ncbi:hypothetical protein OH491_02015 [Termitidicoccus mucosus]
MDGKDIRPPPPKVVFNNPAMHFITRFRRRQTTSRTSAGAVAGN